MDNADPKDGTTPVTTEIAQGRGAEYVLFRAPAVAVAAYSGTPLAGSLLIATNYWRLNQKGRAAVTVPVGLLATAAVVFFWVLLPFLISVPLCLGLLVGTRVAASKLQNEALARHVSRGGRLGSKWIAFWIGAACLGLLIVVLRIFVSLTGPLR